MVALDNGVRKLPRPASPAVQPLPLVHGVVQSEEEAVIASRMTALITALPFDAGQSFSRGQMLVRFDCSQMQAQLNAADAASVAYQKTYDTNVELDRYKAIGTNEVAVSKANLGKGRGRGVRGQGRHHPVRHRRPLLGQGGRAHRPPATNVAASGQPLMRIQEGGRPEGGADRPLQLADVAGARRALRLQVGGDGRDCARPPSRAWARLWDPVSKTLRVTGEIETQQGVLPGMSGRRPTSSGARCEHTGRRRAAAANCGLAAHHAPYVGGGGCAAGPAFPSCSTTSPTRRAG